MNEQLSPQGYNITMDPKNNNPFWDNEPGPTPTPTTTRYYVTNMLPFGLYMSPMTYEENGDYTTLIGGYLTAGLDVIVTQKLTNKYRINSFMDADATELKIVYNYYNEIVEHNYSSSQWFIQRITDLKMADHLNNISYKDEAIAEFGVTGGEAYDDIDDVEVPENYKVIKCVMISDQNTFGPIIYIPFVQVIEETATYPLMSGIVTFTEE